jgi:diguanylate cyclase (GGDEF)-like protein
MIRDMKIRYREGTLPKVTVSVGIAGSGERQIDEAALLRAADDALYAAKAGGRDRIVVAPPSA